MNITFLIGNGFDLNLGLDTKYSDFIKVYKNIPSSTDVLKKLNKHIKENEETWSSAETALGKFTKEFNAGEGELFSECQLNLCEYLALYLKDQEKRINYDFSTDDIKSSFKNVNNIFDEFPLQEKAIFDDIYQKKSNETRVFNFVNFNYTNTLAKCIEIVGSDFEVYGSHMYNQRKINHGIGKVVHVHGTVDKDMIFGVNDETQIARNDIFDCENGDLFKGLLIKQTANASYMENIDSRVAKIIEDSQIIYIYGMSIGQTDKLWWNRICNWLNASKDHHLIIQKHGAPAKSALPLKYQFFERNSRIEFTHYCDFEPDTKKSIESRIHISSKNIFENVKDIAKDSKEKSIYISAKNTLSNLGAS